MEITEKQIVKKGQYHKFYKMVPNLFVAPNRTKEEIEDHAFLKKVFRTGVKFSAIGFAGVFSWIITQPKEIIVDKIKSGIESDSGVVVEYTDLSDVYKNISVTDETVILSIAVPVLVISAGIVIERILSKLWNKKKKRG